MDQQRLLTDDLRQSVDNYGVNEERGGAPEPKLYKRRWIMLAIVALLTAENYAQWLSYSAISNIVEYHFNVSSFLVQLLSLNNIAMVLLFGLPTTFLINQTDLKTGCLIGGFVSLVGLWIKYFSSGKHGFSLTLCGQIATSLGTPFLRPMPAQLASTWFGVCERSSAISLTSSAFCIGTGLGFLLSTQLVPDSKSHSAIEDGIQRTIFIQAIICSVTIIATVFLFQGKPPSPPSRSQASIGHKPGLEIPSYLESMRRLITNRSCMHLVFAFGIIMGVFCSIFSLLNEIVLLHHPGKETTLGWMGFFGSVIAIPGTILIGVWLDWSKSYKMTCVTCTGLITLTTLAFTLAIKYSAQLWVLFVLVLLFGFFTAALNPIAFVLGGELTYPVAEILSSGILITVAQFFGVLLLAITSYTVSAVNVDFVNWLMSGACFVAFLLTFFVKSDFRRLAEDVTNIMDC